MNNYPSNYVYLYSVHIFFHTTVFNKTNKRQNKTILFNLISVWETDVLLYLIIFAEVTYFITINLSVSICQYQFISINLSVSIYQNQFISINLSVSVYQYQFISISLSVSIYQYQFISISLSVSVYQYQFTSINLSVSVYQYQFISINLHGVLRFKKKHVPFIKDRETLSTYSFLTDI